MMSKKSKRWTEAELKKHYPSWITEADKSTGHIRNKGRYGNVNKPVHDGIRFDSKREFLRYMDLKLLEKAGEITELKVHTRYPIIIGGVPVRIKSERYNTLGRQMVYVADFSYRRIVSEISGLEVNRNVIEDVKMQSGHRTEVYKIKKALMDAMGYTIEEY